MGCTRALVIAIVVAMTTKATMGFIPYAVQSSIVDLMDERDFIGLQRVKFSRENVRPIYRKDMSVKEVRLKFLTVHVLLTSQTKSKVMAIRSLMMLSVINIR